MKIGFIGTPAMPSYRIGSLKLLETGAVIDMEKEQAERLLKQFPDNFRTKRDHETFVEAADLKVQEAAAVKQGQAPAGDPTGLDEAGDTTGANLDEVSAENRQKYADLAAKIDDGGELTENEEKFMEAIDALDADEAGDD